MMMRFLHFPGARRFSSRRFLPALLFVLPLASCEPPIRPEKAEAPPQKEEAAPPSSPAPEETKETSPAPAGPEESQTASQPAEPRSPMLEVREDEAAKEIRVSGRISSTYQKDDLMSGLKGAFGYMTIVDELEVDSQLPEVTWGNRVNDFLLPFLDVAKDAHFQYDKGVTLIKGTVKERKQINQLGNMVVYVMEAADSRGISNQVKVNEAENEPEKK